MYLFSILSVYVSYNLKLQCNMANILNSCALLCELLCIIVWTGPFINGHYFSLSPGKFLCSEVYFDINMDYNLLLISACNLCISLYLKRVYFGQPNIDSFLFWPWWLVCWDYHVDSHSCRMNNVKAAVDFLETWLLEFSGR